MAFVQRLLLVFSSVVILGFFPPFEWIVLSSRIRPSDVVESVFFMIVTPGFPLDQSGCNSKNVFIYFSHKLWIFKHKMYFYHLRKQTHSELNRWFRVLLISLKVFGEVFFEEVAVWKLNGISNIWTKQRKKRRLASSVFAGSRCILRTSSWGERWNALDWIRTVRPGLRAAFLLASAVWPHDLHPGQSAGAPEILSSPSPATALQLLRPRSAVPVVSVIHF